MNTNILLKKSYIMKKRKYLQTDFIKFILEKYSKSQELTDDHEVENLDDEKGIKQKQSKQLVEFEDENEPTEDEKTDEEIIDELLKEYKRLKRKNENYRLHNNRKR